MKIVMRGVLLDITYSRDSYFATLQDNTEEIALEDTFVPDVRHMRDSIALKLSATLSRPQENVPVQHVSSRHVFVHYSLNVNVER
ncbi:hypothetical protein PInf_008674 [Phytophthora infestans]|nr:hypothetical protein PInf_008674 [Phytophthora infestans]